MNKTFYAAAVTTNLQCTADRYEELLKTANSHNNLWGWRNDRAVGQIAVMSLEKDISSLSVSMSAFVRDGSEALPAENVKCSFIRETKAFVGSGKYDNKTRGSFPDVIWNAEPVSLKAKSLVSVWVSFDIPKGIKTGEYKGNITLKDEDTGYSLDVPYSVRVLALTMPEPEDYYFDIELWQYPYRVSSYYGLEPFGKKHTELLKKHMLIYKNMGGNAITASILHEPWAGQTYGEYPSMVKWTKGKDGKFAFDFTDFDKWVALNKEIGIGDKIVCYSLAPWSGKVTYYDEKRDKIKSVSLKPESISLKRFGVSSSRLLQSIPRKRAGITIFI